MPNETIRPVCRADARDICGIYNHYVETTTISFEEEPVGVEEMERRIADISSTYPWLVAENEGRVIGYAYASAWKSRSAYRQTVETSVYVDRSARGKGIGRALYAELIPALRSLGLHAALGGIALPNDASVRFHEAFGFSKVGQLVEVGIKFGKRVDVGYWELLL